MGNLSVDNAANTGPATLEHGNVTLHVEGELRETQLQTILTLTSRQNYLKIWE